MSTAIKIGAILIGLILVIFGLFMSFGLIVYSVKERDNAGFTGLVISLPMIGCGVYLMIKALRYKEVETNSEENTSLSNGILFEDNGRFLKWGDPIEKLKKTFKAKQNSRGDRDTFEWGKHIILNGLELDLSTTYWNFGTDSYFRKFKSIDFWAYGDEEAERYLNLIKSHLIKEFGEPHKTEITKPDEFYAWTIEGATIDLCLFDQHVYKLHLEISKK